MRNPLHEPGGADTAWSIVNAAENFPGVATPLGWTFWRDPLERGIRGGFANFGVLPESEVRATDPPDDRFSTAFFGRFAGNVDKMRAMADLMPGSSGSEIELQIFGSVRPDIDDHPSRRRYPAVAVKMPLAIYRTPRRLSDLRTDTDSWWKRNTAPAAIGSPEQARALLLEGSARFESCMRIHISTSMWASALFTQLSDLADHCGRPGLETALVSGYGGMEETECIAALWDVAQGTQTIEEFLHTHGYHAPVEAELRSLSWREDPAPALARARSYARRTAELDPARLHHRQREQRISAERELLAALPAYRRSPTRVLLRMAARYIPLREVGKAALLQTIDVARAAARYLGTSLHEAGTLQQSDDVYFLTFEEAIMPTLPNRDAAIAERRRQYEDYQSRHLPDFWIGEPSQDGGDDVADTAARLVTGIAVSPGVVEGIARVMTGPDSGELEDEEILVCNTTDPSWTSLFPIARGLVIDIGGPMSHGAIVAREMGIPCVINTKIGTRAIATGDKVRVNGGTGAVEILR